MATPARAKYKTGSSLDTVFDGLVTLMKRHAPPFRTDVPCMSAGKKSFQLTVPKPVSIPDAYGGKPVDLPLASAILQKDFVGFYLMCIYTDGAANKKISPALRKLLRGKSCFHLKQLDDGLSRDISDALDEGTKTYRSRGWL
jgi:hypothetical protein